MREGCGGIFAEGCFRGERRDAGRDHEGFAAADSKTGGEKNDGGDVRADGSRGGSGVGDHRGAGNPVHAGVFGSNDDSLRGGLREDWFAPGLRGVAADGNGWASGGGGGGSGGDGADLQGVRRDGSARGEGRRGGNEAGERAAGGVFGAGAS